VGGEKGKKEKMKKGGSNDFAPRVREMGKRKREGLPASWFNVGGG